MSLETWHNMLHEFEKIYDDSDLLIYLPSSVKKNRRACCENPDKSTFSKKEEENKAELGNHSKLVHLIVFKYLFFYFSIYLFIARLFTSKLQLQVSHTCIRGIVLNLKSYNIMLLYHILIYDLKMESYALKKGYI